MGIGHCQHGEPEGECNTEQAHAGLGKGSGNDGGAATAQGQPERADQLGLIFLCDLAAHEEVPPWRAIHLALQERAAV
jgi:hypothetical protein